MKKENKANKLRNTYPALKGVSALGVLTAVMMNISSAMAFEWCRHGGSVVDRYSCVGVGSDGGVTNRCNMTVFFYWCYDDNGSYSCGARNEPTQFGGITANGTTYGYDTSRPIHYWAFTCE